MIESYTSWLIRWRYLVVISSILLVVALGNGMLKLTFSDDYRVFFGPENPQLRAFENLQDTYTKNDNVLFMLEPKDGNVFSQETLQAVIDLTEASWQLPYSLRVDSISNYQHSYADGDNITIEELISDTRNLNKQELNRIRKVVFNEPLLVNRLVSPSGHTTGVNTTIQVPGIDTTAELIKVVKHARKILYDFQLKHPDIKIYLTGVVMMNNAFSEASIVDMQTLMPLALGAIILGLVIFLRSFTGMIATILVVLLSIAAAMGTAGWLGYKITPPSATAPTMILTLAVADCVHLLVSIIVAMRHGMNRHDAIIESMRINFHPIFLTSLTTIFGFLTLNFSDVPPFHDLGNITSMGIAFAFLFAVYFLPAFIAIVPIRVQQHTNGQLTLMEKLAEFVIRKRRTLLWSMSLLILVITAFISKNELNDVFVEYFDKTVEFRQHADHITENLTGMYYIDYSLDGMQTSAISDPEFLSKVEAFTEWYRKQPEVLYVNSFTTIMKRLNKNMHGDDPSMYKLPDNRKLAAEYLLMYEWSLPSGLDINNQINIDKSSTRLSISIKTLSSNSVIALEERAQQWLLDHAPELYTQGASPSIMFSYIGARNIKSMLIGTTLALILISCTLVIALRSIKYGVLSLIPNLLPACVGFGLWGIFVSQVGLSLSIVASMTLGVVVDDTVHFLSKFLRARREKQLNSHDAVRYAFSTVGVALVVTTLVLMAGFIVLSFSTFELNAGMGLLTAITIAIALLVDFLLLPPLLMSFKESKNEKIMQSSVHQPVA